MLFNFRDIPKLKLTYSKEQTTPDFAKYLQQFAKVKENHQIVIHFEIFDGLYKHKSQFFDLIEDRLKVINRKSSLGLKTKLVAVQKAGTNVDSESKFPIISTAHQKFSQESKKFRFSRASTKHDSQFQYQDVVQEQIEVLSSLIDSKPSIQTINVYMG